MKLQKIFAYRYGDKPRYKYLINLPEELINEIGWEAGSELDASIKNGKIMIDFVAKPSKNTKKNPEPKMSYEEFRDKIKQLLTYHDGLTWTQIREELDLPQIVPNNKWVRKMESEIGLIRLKDPKGVLWKIRHG